MDPSSVRRSTDIDGCGCLRCQGVDHAIRYRGIGGTFVWSYRFVRSRSDVLSLVVALVVFNVGIGVLPLVYQLIAMQFAAAGLFVARGYVGVICTATLTDRAVPVRAALRRTLVRTPAAVGSLLLGMIGVVFVAIAWWALLWPLTLVFPSTVHELGAAVGIVLLAIYVTVKLCLVPEACILGGYGPVTALRVSWGITSFHRAKALVIFVGFAAAIGIGMLASGGSNGLLAMWAIERGVDTGLVEGGAAALDVARSALGLIASILCYGAFAHLYVAGVTDLR